MRVFLIAVLLAGCNRSASIHAHSGVSITLTAPAEECDQIRDVPERKICLQAVKDQKKLDAKQQPSQPK